jgi:hypothetical protein
MNATLPHLSRVFLIVAAVAPQAAAAVVPPRAAAARPPSEGDQLLRRAITSLSAHQGVKATVRQQAQLFGYRLLGKGSYLQQGRGAEIRNRLELTIEADGQTSSLLQIADGRYLWSERRDGDSRHVERIDVGRVRKQLGKLTGNAAPVPHKLLAFGGLPDLLASLLQHFQFAPPKASHLGDMQVYRLVGRWRTAPVTRLAVLAGAPTDSGATTPKKRPSPRVPREVVVLLGRDDLFPYVIQYAGGPTDETGQGRAAGSSLAMLRIELYEVQIDGLIDPRQFVYRPDDVESVDATGRYVKRLQGPAP